MSGNITDPIPLPPDSMSDRDFGVQLHAHLEIALEGGFGNGPGPVDGGGIALEAIHHGV